MMGKISFWGTLVVLGILVMISFTAVPHPADSATTQTGTTVMNVTIRGWVSLSASTNLTTGIVFNDSDSGTEGNNATANWGEGQNGGSGYNLTVNSETTVTINFTQTSNRSNLTTGTYILDIGNVTTNSNSTKDNGTNLPTNESATALEYLSWRGMEDCEGIAETGGHCWITYFLGVPTDQAPGSYETGYCWCGRQQGTADTNCGTCTT